VPAQAETGLLPAFADPVMGSQQVFRAVLDAMARPGSVAELDVSLTAPAPLNLATTALLLALVDGETPLWLDGAAATGAVMDYARFHCGCRLTAGPRDAAFAVIADVAQMPSLSSFAAGNDEYPDRSATLIVQVPSLTGGRALGLTGPGIHDKAKLAVAGLPSAFSDWWRDNQVMFPCGVDMIFTNGKRVVALPRSTRLAA
jgi:alpha-D-ribose 1-methylphosphonate 5-triphosphate synthase subunit PhnH